MRHSRMRFKDPYFSRGCQFIDKGLLSLWEVVTTGYLDINSYRRSKAQVTSQIESTCQCRQRGQKSCKTSTLTLRNAEAVTYHFSYDTEGEKQMGSASYQTENTQKI